MENSKVERVRWCLACASEMSRGGVCGSCGAFQDRLIKQRAKALRSLQSDAKSAMKACQFGRASRIASQLLGESCEELRHFADWGAVFVESVEKERRQAVEEARRAIAKSLLLEQSHQYARAVDCIQAIPPALHQMQFVGVDESPATLLQRLLGKRDNVGQLEAYVCRRFRDRELQGLLPFVKQLCVVKHGDEKVASMLRAVEEFEQICAQECAFCHEQSEASLKAGEYEKALAVLSSRTTSYLCERCEELGEKTREAIVRRDSIFSDIASGRYERREYLLQRALAHHLAISPGDQKVRIFKDRVDRRVRQAEGAQRDACRIAEKLLKSGEFKRSLLVLKAAAKGPQADWFKEFVQKVTDLASEQSRVLAVVSAANTNGRGGRQALQEIGSYEDRLRLHGVRDLGISGAAREIRLREKRVRLQESIRYLAFGMLVLVGGGFCVVWGATYYSGYTKEVSLRRALADRRWTDAIDLDERCVDAYLGRALEEVNTTNPDYDAALSDLAQADRVRSGNQQVREIAAEIYAWRALHFAQSEDFSHAVADLGTASRLSPEREAVVLAGKTTCSLLTEQFYSDVVSLSADNARESLGLLSRVAVGREMAARGALLITFVEAVESFRRGKAEAALRGIHALLEGDMLDLAIARPILPVDFRLAVEHEFQDVVDEYVRREDWLAAATMCKKLSVIISGSDEWLRDRIAKADEQVAAKVPFRFYEQFPVLKNPVGMSFRLLPPGCFAVRSVEEREVESCLTRPLYMGVFETTEEDWGRVMGGRDNDLGNPRAPVCNVSWFDAALFCEELNSVCENADGSRVYRLPTEAEWEFACRAGTGSTFSCGESATILSEFAWFGGRASGRQSVGGKHPNAWGLYDMHGNVREWCGDWFGDYSAAKTFDYLGPRGGTQKVCRGGSWMMDANACGSAVRGRNLPAYRSRDLGFRVVFARVN